MEPIPQHAVFQFESIEISSDFDSGNIEFAKELEKNWFGLWTSPDACLSARPSNCRSWFYFKVTSKTPKTLKFTIKNLNLQNKLFSEGMKPVYKSSFSDWKRVESKVEFQILSDNFEITFSHTCSSKPTFFAFTYPWSLLENDLFLNSLQKTCKDSNLYYSKENLINTLQRRPCYILTITSQLNLREKREKNFIGLYPETNLRCHKFSHKRVVFLTSRVHPGEVQSSHVLNGFLKFICGPDKRAEKLRDLFIFKIVPILNPDGVFHGHYRTDTRGANLNRHYRTPLITEHPTIFAVKELMKYYNSSYNVAFYLDLHGHASKKGCFVYGNYMDFTDQIETCLFAKYMQLNCVNFDFEACNFTEVNMRSPDKRDGLSKEGSSRVAFFKELGILRSYTLECNYNTGRVLNKLLKPEDDLSDVDSQLYLEGPPKFGVEVFEDVGKAVGVCLIDLEKANPLTRVKNYGEVKLEVARYVGNMVPFRYDPIIRKACKGQVELEDYLEQVQKEKLEKRGLKSQRFKSRQRSSGCRSKFRIPTLQKEEIKQGVMGGNQGSNSNLHQAQDSNLAIKKNSFLPLIKPVSTCKGKSLNRKLVKML